MSKNRNKKPYSGDTVDLSISIPVEWNQFLEVLSDNKAELISFLIANELYKHGMVNIEPKFDRYNKPFNV